ncbi:hypothetical protein L7F22_008951 [Adiantum nelumboides]|nr:hypothetical protein [Adiantum nelumboides]
MLKAHFRIFLKRCDMDLSNVPCMVAACLVLHNMCILHRDDFDIEWIQEAQSALEAISQVRELCPLARTTMRDVAAISTEDLVDIVQHGQEGEDVVEAEDVNAIGPNMRDNLARPMFKEFLRRRLEDMNGVEEENGSSLDA